MGVKFSCLRAGSADPQATLVPPRIPDHIREMKKTPFRLTPYQVQWLLVVGFLSVGYALYLRYLAVEFSTVALACDAGLQSTLCKARSLATYLFRNSVFGVVALIIAVLHVIRPSIVLLTGGLIAAGFGDRALQHRAVGPGDRPAYPGLLRGPRLPQRDGEQEIDRARP